MKQLIQNYKSGELQLVEVPDPIVRPGGILLETRNSLISVGTEKLMISMAQKGYLGKALARPDLVKQVINKIKTDGLLEAYKATMNRLDNPVTLGYSSAGIVKERGANVDGIMVGDRVACFGDGFATHSEMTFVPKNMFVKIPENISFEDAAFVGLGSIALNAIRCANLTFGENVAVLGLGLLGQLCVQMLKGCGAKVFGIDISEGKLKLACELGCDAGAVIGKDDVLSKIMEFTSGKGADAVIIMAGSSDNKPIELAAEISRERGRIVACGMINLDVPRQEFFKKELTVIVSRATGPGKFDPLYENAGIDYPFAYVRWTTQRNMEYFLQLVSEGKVKLDKVITHRFPIENALSAYEMIFSGKESCLGVLIEYTGQRERTKKIELKQRAGSADFSVIHRVQKSKLTVGLIGAGLHANVNMLPELRRMQQIRLRGIADADGYKGRHSGKKFGFEYCVSDYQELLKDSEIDAVMIATRHNLHAQMVLDSLKAGKHVFVEKPLVMNEEELKRVVELRNKCLNLVVLVGFNRRFSPMARQANEFFSRSQKPAVINCRVNAGFVPADSWVFSSTEGGGRVVGEVCHFVDLLQYFSGSIPTKVYASASGADNLVLTIEFKNQSVGTILYSSEGDRSYPRERIEIFKNQGVVLIENFKSMQIARNGVLKKINRFNQDRGYRGEFEYFANAILKTQALGVKFEDHVYTSLITFAVLKSINTGMPVEISDLSL